MNITKIFGKEKVRIIIKNEIPYFNTKDVCDILEMSNPSSSIALLDKDDVHSMEVIDKIGRKQQMNFVNEGGLYQLIFRSRKESAVKFKKWVTHEVLPSIRKTGKYSIPENLKKKSTENRNILTSEWSKHGIKNPNEFMRLTVKEYRELNIENGKRKKDFNQEELLLLNALESMESLKLFYDESIIGLSGCSKSIEHTAKNIKRIAE